jgi:hypothetical protein
LSDQKLLATGYRLPLKAEWEFAARGGNRSNGYTYAGSNDLNEVGWYWDNSGGVECNLSDGRSTWPLGEKAANELGLYDMSGNVWGTFVLLPPHSWWLVAQQHGLWRPLARIGDYSNLRTILIGFRPVRSSVP